MNESKTNPEELAAILAQLDTMAAAGSHLALRSATVIRALKTGLINVGTKLSQCSLEKGMLIAWKDAHGGLDE